MPDRKVVLPARRFFSALHDLCHEAAHRLSDFILLLPRGVGVGAESEPGIIVTPHGGHRCFATQILRGVSCRPTQPSSGLYGGSQGQRTGKLRELPFSLYYMLKAEKQGNVLEVLSDSFFCSSVLVKRVGVSFCPKKSICKPLGANRMQCFSHFKKKF